MNIHKGALALLLITLSTPLVSTRPDVRQAAPLTPVPPRVDTASVTPQSSVEQLQQDILAVTRSAGVERGVWGIVVQSLDRSERLFELNPRTLMVPASAAKLVAGATGVDAVGWDYRFETLLQTNGVINNGVLRGDLLIIGAGDPSIGGRDGIDLSAWLGALKAFGVSRIEGRVIGDDNLLEEPRPGLSWAWDDLGTSGTIYGALNLHENRMPVAVWPGAAAGRPAELVVDPFAQQRPLISRVVTGERNSGQLLWTEQRPGELALTIAGSIAAGAMPVVMSVSVGNPTLWFARSLRHQLIAAGIDVTGEAYDLDDMEAPPDRTTLTVLHTHRSPPLSDLVKPTFKESINLYAEALFRLNAPRTTPTNDAAIERLRGRLAEWSIPPDGQQLVDGSGLSRRDTATAETLVLILQRMYDTDATSPWMAALPVAGTDGTLQNRMKGTAAERNVRAKTGSMSNIRTLAGYVTTKDGERLAFAILLNNFEGPGAGAVQALDGIAVRLASFSRKAAPPAR